MPWVKAEIDARIRKVVPTDGDLELIERSMLSGETFNPEDFFIGRMSLANTLYDRSGERFPESYLQRFAATLPGKGVMIGHDYTREPAGRFFTAKVDGGADGHELVPSYYLLNSDPLTAKVKAGIANYVSIGFNPDIRICDIDGKDYDGWWKGEEDPCAHIALREYDGQLARVTYGGDVQKAEALEGSFVWLGCQYGAQTMGANQVLSPRAKAAFFEDHSKTHLWAPGNLVGLRYEPPFDLAASNAAIIQTLKEKAMPPDIEKGAPPRGDGPPPEAKLTPEQERLIALGSEYVKFAQEHVKSRYAACKQERTGERLARAMETASPEEIAADLKAADEIFNEFFPGTGKGVPMSDGRELVTSARKFNPLSRGRF